MMFLFCFFYPNRKLVLQQLYSSLSDFYFMNNLFSSLYLFTRLLDLQYLYDAYIFIYIYLQFSPLFSISILKFFYTPPLNIVLVALLFFFSLSFFFYLDIERKFLSQFGVYFEAKNIQNKLI